MTDTTGDSPLVRSDDEIPLKTKLRRTTRRKRVIAFGLVSPLLAFIVITFMVPIILMLFRSVDNPTVGDVLPETIALLQQWNGEGTPDEAVYAAIAGELVKARKAKTIGRAASRLNFEMSGVRSVITKSARKISKIKSGPYKEALIKIDEAWGNRETWATIKLIGARFTHTQYLAALDMRQDADGNIVDRPEERQIYRQIFVRTIWISLLVTVVAIFLGYPISYLLATLPLKTSNLLMILVLLPFWTSLLVRTTAWIVLLQSEGVINDLIMLTGLVSERPQLIYNQFGTIVAMVHILLPFMVLPIYSVMKTIPPSYMRAAQSLGATPFTAFVRVYLPQTVPGIGAGSILVFILSIGYYITPALVGGRTGQLISNFIAYHMQKSLNWGLAAALGAVLLAGVLVAYWLYNKVVGIDKMKFG